MAAPLIVGFLRDHLAVTVEGPAYGVGLRLSYETHCLGVEADA